MSLNELRVPRPLRRFAEAANRAFSYVDDISLFHYRHWREVELLRCSGALVDGTDHGVP